MKKYFHKIICIITSVLLMLTGCSRQPVSYKCADTAMGTIMSQTIYVSTDEKDAQEISKQVIARMTELECNTLSWRLATSEVYRINESAGGGQAVEISPFLGMILEQCQKVYAASDGAFDFTIGSVTRLWNIDAWAGLSENEHSAAKEKIRYTLPAEEQIEEALQFVGGDRCEIEDCLLALPEGMQLDLGAVGKGIALDETKKLLRQQKQLTGAVISAGGSILTYGTKPDGNPWMVGIVNPFDTGKTLGTLSLSDDFCVSTSGDYERYVEVDGVRYHHILDSHTGMPADSGVKSVTVLRKVSDSQDDVSGLLTDALSTACFVLGEEEGLKLAELFEAEVLFVGEEGEITMSEGMKQYFYLSNVEK